MSGGPPPLYQQQQQFPPPHPQRQFPQYGQGPPYYYAPPAANLVVFQPLAVPYQHPQHGRDACAARSQMQLLDCKLIKTYL
jgi:hypothetical protein